MHERILADSQWRCIAAILGVVLLAEGIIALDLVPILILVPKSVGLLIALSLPILFAVGLGCYLVYRGKLQFSMKAILFLLFLIAWPTARLTNELRVELRRTEVQKRCFEQLVLLGPKGITASGRYNDGHKDYAIQRLLFAGVAGFLDPTKVPYEISRISGVDLSGTDFRDKDIPVLVATETLETVDLSGTQVTDVALSSLAKLPALREVNLGDTAVTEAAIEELKTALPGLSVVR